jgi:hypothetical protein
MLNTEGGHVYYNGDHDGENQDGVECARKLGAPVLDLFMYYTLNNI